MKRLLVGATGLIILGSFVWLLYWWQSPAETTDYSSAGQTEAGVLGSEVELVSWRTKYFATSYPATLRVVTSNELTHGSTFGQYVLGSVSPKQTNQLAITVGPLQGTTLRELPAVMMRQQQTELYRPTSRTYVPIGGLAFTSTQDYETAVFWQEGNRYVAVVVSGSAMWQAELEDALQTVITYWQ